MADKKTIQVKVREGMYMPLENGGNAEGGDVVSVSETYFPKIEYFCEPQEEKKK